MAEEVDFLIVGGGLPGLLAAHQIKQSLPSSRVLLVEAAKEVGGLYRSVFVAELGAWVDLGMHVYYETGIEDYDTFIKSVLPPDSWSPMEGVWKDVAGIYWDGQLQKHSPYPDLRRRPLKLRLRALAAMAAQSVLACGSRAGARTAEELGRRQFGGEVFDRVIAPILGKLYETHPSELATIALKSPELRRLVIFGPKAVKILGRSRAFRSRLAYPDQFTLPFRRPPQAGYYPKAMAFGREVLEPVVLDLTTRGVDILTATSVVSVAKSEDGVWKLQLRDSQQSPEAPLVDVTSRSVVWCAPLSSCASAIGLDIPKPLTARVPSRKKHFAVALLEGDNRISPLYYFYVYDPGFDIFRVTNFGGYSTPPSALGENRFVLGVEVWSDRDLGDGEVIDRVKRELTAMGITDDRTRIAGTWLLSPKAPPHEPTIDNEQWHLELASAIRSYFGASGFVATGPFAKPDLFFLQDVLRDLYPSVEQLIGEK